jgi:hypothetical protein
MLKFIYHWYFEIKDLLRYKRIKINAYYTLKTKKETIQLSFPLSVKYNRGRFKPWRIFSVYIYILCFCISISYDSGIGRRNMFV